MNDTLRATSLFMLAYAFVFSATPRVRAGQIFTANETAFDRAAPSLATQTFASANVAANGISVISNRLNSSTSDPVFAAGSIAPGLSFFSSASHTGQDLAVVASGLFGNTSKLLANNFGGDSLDIAFSPAVTAVALGLFDIGAGNSQARVTVKSQTGAVIGSTTVTGLPTSGAGLFLGVLTDNGDQIGEIDILGNGSLSFAALDRVRFGLATTAVPEPSTAVSLVIGGACAGLAEIRRRSRSKDQG